MRRTLVTPLAAALLLVGAGNASLSAAHVVPPPLATAGTAKRDAPQAVRVIQPVQRYFLPFGEEAPAGGPKRTHFNPLRFATHLGTDYGRIGPGGPQLAWKPGQVCVDLPAGTRAGPAVPDSALPAAGVGMWHSLAGLAADGSEHLDFLRCYPPFIRDSYQPRCIGITLRVQGSGALNVEIISATEQVLWQRVQTFQTGDRPQEVVFACAPAELREAKFLNWVAAPGSHLCIQSLGLVLEFPPLPFAERIFLVSYAKLARCYVPAEGIVRDHADAPAGAFEGVPASGLFCLATAAAADLGIVDRTFARETLHKVGHTVAGLPRAQGLLPHFITKEPGGYHIHPHTEYSTADTSLYYHSMLLAAQMLEDPATLADLTRAVQAIRFDRLRDPQGFIVNGLREDGRTPLCGAWRDWGGETALVLLLEQMATGRVQSRSLGHPGQVYGGIGFVGEVQSLFYPHFASAQPDALTGVNWLAARQALLKEQRDYFPHTWPGSAAARIGVYGLSAGEGFRGHGYAVNGTHLRPATLIHPHYILMSGLLWPHPDDVYRLLQGMEGLGLLPPWGLVENVTADLGEYLPWIGSLNAGFESISAYHLWAQQTGRPDRIYEAARDCPLLNQAIEVFYPGQGKLAAAPRKP